VRTAETLNRLAAVAAISLSLLMGLVQSASADKTGINLACDPCEDAADGQYVLTITCGQGGTVSIEVASGTSYQMLMGPGSFVFDDGVEVSLMAAPRAGWQFTGWTGTMSSDESPFTFMLTADQSLDAHFTQNPWTLTITCGPGVPALANCAAMYCFSSALTVSQSRRSSSAISLIVAERHRLPT